MKEYGHRIVLYLTIVGLLSVIFMQRSCAPQIKQYNASQQVTIPKKEGSFDKPVAIINDKSKKDSVIYNGQKIVTENPVNKKLVEDYIKSQKENDSLKALNLYLKAIEERTETRVFDNKDMKIKVNTKTRGEILNMKVDYERKEFTENVKVQEKETKFALYAGAGLDYTSDLNKLTPKAIIGIQNSKGDIISVGVGTDKSIQVGYSFRLINIKR